MPTPMLRPLGIGETLDVAIKIYLRNAWTLFRLVLIVVAPVQLINVLISASVQPTDETFYFDETTEQFHTEDIWTFVAGNSVVLILTLISGTLALGLCFKAIADAYLGATVDWREALQFVLRRLHSILWVTILGAIVSVVGFVFCIIPGIYLWVSFTVAVPVLLTERIRGRKALSRSRKLVEGRWWSVFAVVLIGGILTSIVSGALTALDSIVVLTSDDPSSIGSIIVSFLTGTVASMVTTPLTAAIAVVIYIDLRVRHEAFDLQLLAGQLGVDPPEGLVMPAAPLVDPPRPSGGSQPPFWPPPPGWTPGPPSSDSQPSSPPPISPLQPEAPSAGGSQPPFWPPPPGWAPDAPPAPEPTAPPAPEPAAPAPEPAPGLRPPAKPEVPEPPAEPRE